MKPFSILLTFCIFSSVAYPQQEYFPDPDTIIQQRLEQWQDLKFGLLIHWGPYSQWGIVESWSICPEDLSWATGGRKQNVADSYQEYVSQYEALRFTFNPVQFNPERWAAAAANAGMKYVVFTTKHHDGFNMFDTRFSDYRITNKDVPFASNPRSDVTREIFNAFREKGLWTGAYFSKPDWHSDDYWWKHFPPADRNPNYSIAKYPERWKRFVEFTHGQINELVSNYGRLDILWLDGGWVSKKTEEQIKETLLEEYEGSRWARNPQSQDIDMDGMVKAVREKQPHLIVVDRAVSGIYQNYLTPEQHIPDKGLPYPWETCMTMATSWSHVPNDIYKPPNELIEKLVDIVSKGGNLLLNIGPGPEGEFDPDAYNRLSEIGKWMKVNSEAIYDTRMYAAYSEGERIRYARKKDNSARYVYMFDFPKGKVTLTKMEFLKNTRVTLLGSDVELKWKQTAEGAVVTLPAGLRAVTDYVWVLRLE